MPSVFWLTISVVFSILAFFAMKSEENLEKTGKKAKRPDAAGIFYDSLKEL